MATDLSPEPEEVAFVARGERARARALELEQRRADLSDGLPVTGHSVERAKLRAHEALKRAEEAHHAASQRHVDAGRAHRRAAATHEQAAMFAGDVSGESHQQAAEHHRDEAQRHEQAAVDEAAAGELDARRQD
jgi:hypothetical protein